MIIKYCPGPCNEFRQEFQLLGPFSLPLLKFKIKCSRIIPVIAISQKSSTQIHVRTFCFPSFIRTHRHTPSTTKRPLLEPVGKRPYDTKCRRYKTMTRRLPGQSSLPAGGKHWYNGLQPSACRHRSWVKRQRGVSSLRCRCVQAI